MECVECVSRLWEYLDGELEAEEVRAMRSHLTRCLACRPAYHCDRAFLALLAHCAGRCPGASSDLRDTIRSTLRLID